MLEINKEILGIPLSNSLYISDLVFLLQLDKLIILLQSNYHSKIIKGPRQIKDRLSFCSVKLAARLRKLLF